MAKEDAIPIIPEDWFELLDNKEVDDEIIAVTEEIINLAAKQLKLENPNQDEMTLEGSKAWGMTIIEVRDALRTIINLRSTTRLFTRHYGHLFPKDEEGNPILKPKEIALIHGKTEEEVIEAIHGNKEKLSAEGLLYDWPEIKSKRLH